MQKTRVIETTQMSSNTNNMVPHNMVHTRHTTNTCQKCSKKGVSVCVCVIWLRSAVRLLSENVPNWSGIFSVSFFEHLSGVNAGSLSSRTTTHLLVRGALVTVAGS
eukprot:GDKI01013995.1.p1 GENE.GDKI01013995.1~~GDKI01013995.1.p1  ORF type:complete len:113 (-),score=22.08 GDKI01013995.1:21-338(-)